TIPKTLENLQALLLLNLSFNNLEGLLPKEGVAFRNLSRIHVEGNSKLCLDLSCWNNQHRQRISTAISIVIAERGADKQSISSTAGLRGSVGYIPPG
ncbi:hypothetical protein D5086_008214, partial [Populus alba]